MDFLILKPKAFGLDISDLSLKIVNLNQKGKFLSLASWGETRMKSGVIIEGEIKNEEALIEAIKKSVNEVEGKKLGTKNVVVSLPEKKAFLQVIRMPKMEMEELRLAVPFEAENYIPLPIDQVYLDFQVIPSASGYSSKHISILIAAIPKKIVDPYITCIKKAGLSPRVFEIESQSISRALVKNSVSSSPVLLIDFGRSRTSFIIFSGYSLDFTSSISVSSQVLTDVIARSLGISQREAEKLKIKCGLMKTVIKSSGKKEKMKVEEKKVFEAMIPVLSDLIGQIRRYLGYYQTHSVEEGASVKGKKVGKILLCGRGANLNGAVDFFSSELKIPVELGNPWVNILPASLKAVPGLSFKDSLGFTTALGLALRGIRQK